MPALPPPIPIVLAAGASRRMGRPKATLPFAGRSALEHILAACEEAALGPAVVVAGAAEDAVQAAVAAAVAGGAGGARVVHNPRWADGRTTSIQAGLGALAPGPADFLLWPVDVCLPGAAVLAALLAARRARPDRLGWVPSHAGRRGHPVLLARPVAARLLALGPDRPARDVIRALHAEGALDHVEVPDPSVLMEMNDPDGYACWLEVHARGRAASPDGSGAESPPQPG